MVHTLPVKAKSAMLNIAEQLGIRNARRSGLRPYRTRNNSGGSSAEETAAGQCRRLAGHRPVSVTEEETRTGGYGWRYQRDYTPRFGSGFGGITGQPDVLRKTAGRCGATMILPGETKAGTAGTQPCRGISRWAHRDDERGVLAPPNLHGSKDPMP